MKNPFRKRTVGPGFWEMIMMIMMMAVLPMMYIYRWPITAVCFGIIVFINI